MKKILNILLMKRHYLIVEENDVTKVLDVINRHHTILRNEDLFVGYCRWADEPTKWFIHFTTNSKWDIIRKRIVGGGVSNIFEEKRKVRALTRALSFIF